VRPPEGNAIQAGGGTGPGVAETGTLESDTDLLSRTALHRTIEQRAGAGVHKEPYTSATDAGHVRASSCAATYRGRSLWDERPFDVVEGNAKQQWVDVDRGWCYMCQEAFGTNLGVHLSDRDHVSLSYFLVMYTQYPREWDAARTLAAAQHRFATVAGHAAGIPLSADHLHCSQDAARRAELRALLMHLMAPPHHALQHALQGTANLGLSMSGERMFKETHSRLHATMFPPSAAGVHTQFTHKCWGRTNCERIYDALDLAELQQRYGATVQTSRGGKTALLRTLFFELCAAVDAKDGVGADDVTLVLLREALRRMAFELTFLVGMGYMNRVQTLVQRLGYPTLEALHELNAL
jgi:hypothetical protein